MITETQHLLAAIGEEAWQRRYNRAPWLRCSFDREAPSTLDFYSANYRRTPFSPQRSVHVQVEIVADRVIGQERTVGRFKGGPTLRCVDVPITDDQEATVSAVLTAVAAYMSGRISSF